MPALTLFSLEKERPAISPPVFDWMHKSILPLIWLLVFLNPIPYGTSVKEICYYTAAVFFLVLILSRKIKVGFSTPLAIPFALYTGWVIIGIFFALDKPGSLNDLGAHLLKNIWLYYMLCYYFNSRARLTALGWTVIVATVISVSVSMSYYYLYLGNDIMSRYGNGFTRIQINVIGYATLFAVLLSLHLYKLETRRFHRFLIAICMVVTLAASVLGQSRGTLLAIVVSFFIMSRKKMLWAGVVVGLAVFIMISPIKKVVSNPHHYYDRLYPAYFTIEIIKDYPITGTGFSLDALKNHDLIDPEEYEKRLPASVKDPRNVLPHNRIFILPHTMLLNIPVRTGILGLVLYGYLLFVFAREAWRLYKNGKDAFIRSWAQLSLAVMAMYVTKGAVEPVDTAMVEVILYTIFAMLTIAWSLDKETATQPAENRDKTEDAAGLPPITQGADRTSPPAG